MTVVNQDLSAIAVRMREDILEMCSRPGPERRAHPGASLSIVEILVAIFHLLRREGDRLVLSKGHAAPALYAALSSIGALDRDEYPLLRSAQGVLQGHPSRGLPHGIDATTGSLGHGVALGAGFALSQRNRGMGQTFVVLGDGELQEGLVWEAVQVAGALGLGNLTVFVDLNGHQGNGRTPPGSTAEATAHRFRAWGWRAGVCDGHDPRALAATAKPADAADVPLCVVARTVKGRGVAAMEGNEWHQRHVDGPTLITSLAEVRGE